MKKLSATGFVCTAIVIGITIYDIIAIQIGGTQNSVSAWFASFSGYPVPVFAMGFLAGHFIARMPGPQ